MSPVDAASRASVGLGVVAGAWVVVSSSVGFVALDWGRACGGIPEEDYRPLGRGAEAVCGGTFPFTIAFLTFVGVVFVALATLILAWGRSRLSAPRLCALVAALPVLAYAVLRGITLVP